MNETKEPKQRYIISLRYMLDGIIQDYITKPMTEEDFNDDIRGCIKDKLFPIIVPLRKPEVLENSKVIHDEFVYTEAHFNDSAIHVTLGVYHDG